ncbi:hypothetical protein ACOSP7_019334 [Xanthoceras sorbifolium]
MRLPTSCLLSLVYLNTTFILYKLTSWNNWIMNRIAFVHIKSLQYLQSIFLLINKHTTRFLQHFKTQKIPHFAKISHLKLTFHRVFKLRDHHFIITSKNEIINI